MNPITKETMNNLQNTFQRLEIIVFRKYFAPDPQCDNLELLLSNSRQTPLWPKIWPIFYNTVTGLLFTVFRRSICAYHKSNILETLLWNFYLTKLRLIRWPYSKNVAKPHYKPKVRKFKKKILHVSKSSFSRCFLVLSIIVTFWSFYGEILAEPYYCPRKKSFVFI